MALPYHPGGDVTVGKGLATLGSRPSVSQLGTSVGKKKSRPPVKPLKECVIRVRMTKSEDSLIRRAAADAALDVSVYVRSRAVRAARGELNGDAANG